MGPGPLRRGQAAWLCLALLTSCKANPDPEVGPRSGGPPTLDPGPAIALVGATVVDGRVAVTYRLTRGGKPVDAAAAQALQPRFTLAGLVAEPVTGVPAWRSHLLTGAQTAAQLPVAGPGTPPAQVLQAARQPGADVGGTSTSSGDGVFVHAFGASLPAGSWSETLRVGAWLEGAAAGTPATSATLDFVPDGSAPRARELVRDEACAGCHGRAVRHHGGKRSGARLCVTCHTFQSADPDTVDPAALAGATPATDPNPLELGRLLHRVHRGRELPTLYAASSAAAAPALPSPGPLPLPFLPGRNAPVAGRRFSVIGEQGRERVFGRIVQRLENGQPPRVLPAGIAFPRDDRDCDACHAGAAQAADALAGEISRRSCQGCHPDVWFGAGLPDEVHLAHPGGPRADDASCRDCHVPGAARPVVYAPIGEIHAALSRSPRHDRPVVEIVEVRDFTPGKRPTVVFAVSDRSGPLSALDAPSPALDQAPAPSPVPRALTRLTVTVGGPSAPDHAWRTGVVGGAETTTLPFSEAIPLATPAGADGRYAYTLQAALPAGAAGTWVVALDARRSAPTTHYDPAADAFSWPYTGEAVAEVADNALVQVDVAAGAWPGGAPAPRRTVVEAARCNRCHLRLTAHGGRNRLEYCLLCHTPERTDLSRRPRDPATGQVALDATYDGLEERSVQLKVMVHRIHTGARSGPAELASIRPHVIYGYGGNAYFLDEAEFPGDLARCDGCHVGRSFEPEALPADAPPTVADEAPALLHGGALAHAAGEPAVPPLQAACLGCHATAYAAFHVGRYTSGASEQCLGCHGVKGTSPVARVHGVP